MLSSNSRVSIIVPAHNAEAYIRACIESVLRQSYTNWELLIVNDGSTDHTLAICQEYVAKDSRIYVFSQSQSGVSAARNTGLRNASGEFIAFVDADDFIPEDSLDIRVHAIEDADLAICDIDLLQDNVRTHTTRQLKRRTWDREETLHNIALGGELGYQGYLFNKLFRIAILRQNGLSFAEGIAYNEDRLFCISYALHCDKTAVSEEVVYIYRINDSSAMAALKKMTDAQFHKWMSEFDAYDRMLSLLRNREQIYYRLCEEAWNRTKVYLSLIPRREKRLRHASKKRGMQYCVKLLSAPTRLISPTRKIKLFAHSVLRVLDLDNL